VISFPKKKNEMNHMIYFSTENNKSTNFLTVKIIDWGQGARGARLGCLRLLLGEIAEWEGRRCGSDGKKCSQHNMPVT
jgi:hypothetical protein